MPDDTRTATVLFTDLVASTELRARLGEEAADRLGREHDRLLGECVAAHGGTVVKGLGDGLMASFTGAADGVGAAVNARQEWERARDLAAARGTDHLRSKVRAAAAAT